MIRLLFLALIASLVCKLVFGRWPWAYLSGPSARDAARARARRLLGLRAGADRAAIIEAHRRLIGVVHPDRGGTNDQVHEANAARDLLIEDLPDPQ